MASGYEAQPAQWEKESDGPFVIGRVPFGRYRIDVRAPLLGQAKQLIEVEVSRREQWVTLSLPFSRPIDPWGPPTKPVLHGRLQSGSKVYGPMWMKIVGLYADVTAETVSEADGGFSMTGLPEGSYLAIIAVPKKEPAIVRFQFRSGQDLVELTLPEQPR